MLRERARLAIDRCHEVIAAHEREMARIAAERFRGSWVLALAVALVALGWALRIAFEMPEWVAPGEMFEAMESKGGAVEMAREVWGLAIMALVLLWIAWSARASREIAS